MIIALVSISSLFAQQIPVKGVVTDAKSNEPLIGVTVLEKGTNNGSVTNFNGEFTLTVPSNSTLVISYIGYQSQNVKVTGSTVNVALAEDTKQLDEVVVLGYGTAAKRDLTGSIVKVSAKEIANKPNLNPVSSLQGRVSGLTVVNGGALGSDPDVRIRGTVSMAQTKPLYIVDGIFSDNLNAVNPADIESMEVLKDPSSLAIFGVRGACGAIIVSTKKAKSGKFNVNLNSSYGVKKVVNTPEMTDRAGFITLYDEQRVNQGATPYSDYSLFAGNTNWVDVITNKDAFVNVNNISISKGTESNNFYLGFNYSHETGLIKNEDMKKIVFTLNDEVNLTKNLKLGISVVGNKTAMPQTHDFGSALNATPIVEPYNTTYNVYNKLPDAIGGPQIGNPLMFVEGNKNTSLTNQYRFVGNVFMEYNFLKHYTFKTTYYADFGFNDNRTYTPKYKVYNAESDGVVDWNTRSAVSEYKNMYQKTQQDYLLTYKNTFGDHNLTLLGGFTTYYESKHQLYGKLTQNAGGDPIPYDPRFWYVNVYPWGDPTTSTAIYTPDNSNDEQNWEKANMSYLFRALYNYKGKYNVNGSFRRDGSSQISPSHRYQNFWALGGAWFVTEENFMKNQKVFDNLKLKASFGQLGNQFTSYTYPYFPKLVAGNTSVFGENIIPAYKLEYTNNPNLRWETVDAYEGGFEADFLHSALHFGANYYYRKTVDLLQLIDDGTGGRYFTNSGSIRSSGIELEAGYTKKVSNDLSFNIGANLTTYGSKVLKTVTDGYVFTSGNSIMKEGDPMGSFYGYVVEGVYQSYADKLASPVNTLGDYGPGDLKFKDISGANGVPDGKIDAKDRTIIGNPTPDFTYGINLGVNYKNLDLAVELQGVYGNEIYRGWGNGSSYAVFNYRAVRLNRWHGAGTSNWEPQVNDNSAINKQASTYMIEDGSYVRLRNIQLGYTFSPNMINKLGVKSLRLYVSAQNLQTWKHNAGFVPEAPGSAMEFNVDGGGYPVPAITSLGINVTF